MLIFSFSDSVSLFLIYFCVGYAAPITFCVDSLVDWLADSQLLVNDIVGYFSHNYMMPDSDLGKLLQDDILPNLLPYCLPVTSMEKELGDLVCLVGSGTTVTEDDSTPM